MSVCLSVSLSLSLFVLFLFIDAKTIGCSDRGVNWYVVSRGAVRSAASSNAAMHMVAGPVLVIA